MSTLGDELSLEQLDEIIGEENPFDRYRSHYVKFSVAERDCSFPDCIDTETCLIGNVSWCKNHAIQVLGDMLDEKINMYPNRKPRIDFILQAHLNMLEDYRAPELRVSGVPNEVVIGIKNLFDNLFKLTKGDFRNES